MNQRLVSVILFIFFGFPFFITGFRSLTQVMSANSVTDRLASFSLGLVFISIGGGAFYLAYWIYKKSKKDEELREKFPNEPWKWREDWGKGFSSPLEKRTGMFIFVICAFWLIITLPITYHLYASKEFSLNPKSLIEVAFPLFGIIILAQVLRSRQTFTRLGDTNLYFDSFGILGGLFRSSLTLSEKFLDGTKARVCINNKSTYTIGSGDNTSTHTEVLWQKQMTVEVQSIPMSKSLLSMDFEIPYDTLPSFSKKSLGTGDSFWELEVQVPLRGKVLKLTYEIPVFKV